MKSKVTTKFIHTDWVAGAKITEAALDNGNRRFTATIRGWRNFKLGEFVPYAGLGKEIQAKVKSLRDRIDSGDQTVFD